MLGHEADAGSADSVIVMAAMHYTYKKLDSPHEELELHPPSAKLPHPPIQERLGPEELPHQTVFARNPKITKVIASIMFGGLLLLAIVGLAQSAVFEKRATSTSSTTNVPQYFQTTPELFAGKPLITSRTERENVADRP